MILLASALLLVIITTACGCLNNASAAQTDEPIRTRYAPGEITQLANAAQEQADASLNAIAALPPEERTFDNTVVAFDGAVSDYMDAINPLVLMGVVYPDPAIAAEGIEADESSMIFINDVYTRRGLYNALTGQMPRTDAESRLYNLTIRKFEKNGLKLPDDRLAAVRSMNDELSGLESRFIANLNNDNTTLIFSEAELSGMPSNLLAGFKKTPDGKYRVTTKYPDYIAVMKYAEPGETRKAMYMAYYNRQAEENTPLLEEAILLRQRIAHELGYTTWADYRIEGRMAENPGNVMEFLDAIKEPLREKNSAENAELLMMKKELDLSAASLDTWDIAYLQEKLTRKKFSYDENEFREYYPMDNVLQGIFRIYGELFSVEFEEVKNAPVWSPEVRLFRVKNQADGSTAGYLYLDLYPREGKYGHFATAPVTGGRVKDGVRTVPVTAIIGNFQAPTEGRPGLLNTEDIMTLFHEGGHAMHYLLTTVPYGTQSGFSVEWDFVETPSQTLEEWAMDPDILLSLSGHYKDPSKKVPPELLEQVIPVRDAFIGNYYAGLLVNTLEDMEYHTAPGPVNATEVSRRIYNDIYGLSQPGGIHQPATFGHIMDDYDAGYYGYLWSKVYALEIVETFKQEGMTNRTTGMRFRDEILSQGNMQDGKELLRNFLGRDPGVGALYDHIGIEIPKAPEWT